MAGRDFPLVLLGAVNGPEGACAKQIQEKATQDLVLFDGLAIVPEYFNMHCGGQNGVAKLRADLPVYEIA